MQDLFIGVDGGGTKTRAIIQDRSGNTLGEGIGGPGNIRSSVPQSWASVHEAITYASQAAKIKLKNFRVHIGLGMAGTELNSAKQAFLATPHDFYTLVLDSDAHVACLGFHGGKDGAIIIIGTGVIAYQIYQNQIFRAGGYGFPHSDEGGGAWLGMELLRLTFKAFDQRIKWTPLLKKVFAINKNDIAVLSHYANTAHPQDYAQLAPLIFQFMHQDETAHRLMQKAATEINLVHQSLWQQSGVHCPLGLLGGVAPFIQGFTAKTAQQHLVGRQFSAQEGAIMLLKQHLQSKD